MVVELNSQVEWIYCSWGGRTSVSGAGIQEGRKACKAFEEKSLNKKSKCSPSSSKAIILLVEDNKVNILVGKINAGAAGLWNRQETMESKQSVQYRSINMILS
jgi:hypothetical protein